ncbi:unnamed protein product [Adineta steineri]|uniref:Uncharacterized protein n=1 Tax=Adineta steineri TaxID=433720 RepID=A0A818SB37_9BILA|nr:unnamed protein product [Adineta steineri]CAF3667107.1 unnamed protein product [Adineta steineri]
MIITVPNPSLTLYNSLESIYSTTLQCPCANKTIPYQTFISLSPVFHQLCSSGFVTNDWIQQMMDSMTTDVSYDWRIDAYKQFQILSDLCKLANRTIDVGMNKFLSQSFITSYVMNEIDFNKQLNANLNQFYQSTVYNFVLMKDMIQLIQQVNQYHEGIIMQIMGSYPDPALTLNTIENKADFVLYGIEDINSNSIICICATNPSCQRQAVVRDSSAITNKNSFYGYGYNHNMTGWIQSCLARDSILLSTLECLYENSDCFPLFMSYTEKTNTDELSLSSSPSRLQPLVDNPTNSRFPPNTTVSKLVKELMIEKWNPLSSYKQFYESCAPVYCSYSKLSMIGGIVTSLRLISPYLIKFILKFLSIFKKKLNQTNNEVLLQRNNGNQLTIMISHVIKLLYTTLVELNIFSSRDLGSDINRATAKRYGQWATRLYFILFIISLTILIFYTIIQPHPLTKKFDQPSFNSYNHLREIYGDDLKCSCSRIASTYDQFVNIQSVFHSICSSQFVSDEWRNNIINGLAANLSIYEQKDYRRFLSAHLQYLQRLCQLSQQSVNNSINEFLTSLLVTNELLSQNDFHNRLAKLIEQSKSNTPVLFSHLLFFTQSIIHANAFESTYGTNFEYIGVLNIDYNQFNFYSKPIIYDNECSCGLFPTCTTQAHFIERNISKKISVKGMKMGCTPSESLLASTLECFYDQSCLDLIQQYTSYRNSSQPLSTTSNGFSQNTTINELIKNLFVEDWSTNMSYSSYYQQCLPLLCSYTTIKKFNVFYTITLILGLQGGLTIVLKWICPKLVRIGSKIYQSRKVHPVVFIEMPPNTINNTTIQNTTWNDGNRSVFKIIFIISLIICILVGVIIFSIYYARQNSTMIISISDSLGITTTTTGTLMSISSNRSESTCQLKVKRLSIDPQCDFFSSSSSHVIADLNGDNRLDLIYTCEYGYLVNVLLANPNGSFGEVMVVWKMSSILQIRIGDINNDGRIDLIIPITYIGAVSIFIAFGNGNGTFQTENIGGLSIWEIPTDTSIADINNDSNLDIIVIAQYVNEVYVFFGNGNGTFSSEPQLKLFIGLTSYADRLAIADFDNDDYLDIAVMNSRSRHIHIFLRNTNGSFKSQKWFYTAFDINQYNIITNDFNNDYRSDIVFLHTWKNTVSMFYQYNNDTFHMNEQIVIETSVFLESQSIVVRDLNGDNYLDIVLGLPSSNDIYGLLGDGNGNFEKQIIYSSAINSYEDDDNIFNNNICQNIINMSFMNNTLYILFDPCQCLIH